MTDRPASADQVSVVIPAFRAGDTIERALASVAAQTAAPLEAIVVVDGDEDDTAARARAMAAALGKTELRVIEQARAGAGGARNRGVEEARGSFIAFLDADDEWLPEHVARSLAHFADDVVLTAHNETIVVDGSETLNDCARRFRAGDPFVELYKKGYLSTSTVMARRDAVLAAGGFDTELPNAQDFDLWLAMLADPAHGFVVFDELLAKYHVTGDSIMSHVGRRLDCCLTVARRHAPALRGRLSAPLPAVWYRVAAIHYEAWRAFLARGRWLSALGVAAVFPVRFAAVSEDYVTAPGNSARTAAGLLLWVWVLAVFGTYVWHLRDYLPAVLRLLRLG